MNCPAERSFARTDPLLEVTTIWKMYVPVAVEAGTFQEALYPYAVLARSDCPVQEWE